MMRLVNTGRDFWLWRWWMANGEAKYAFDEWKWEDFCRPSPSSRQNIHLCRRSIIIECRNNGLATYCLKLTYFHSFIVRVVFQKLRPQLCSAPVVGDIRYTSRSFGMPQGSEEHPVDRTITMDGQRTEERTPVWRDDEQLTKRPPQRPSCDYDSARVYLRL